MRLPTRGIYFWDAAPDNYNKKPKFRPNMNLSIWATSLILPYSSFWESISMSWQMNQVP